MQGDPACREAQPRGSPEAQDLPVCRGCVPCAPGDLWRDCTPALRPLAPAQGARAARSWEARAVPPARLTLLSTAPDALSAPPLLTPRGAEAGTRAPASPQPCRHGGAQPRGRPSPGVVPSAACFGPTRPRVWEPHGAATRLRRRGEKQPHCCGAKRPSTRCRLVSAGFEVCPLLKETCTGKTTAPTWALKARPGKASERGARGGKAERPARRPAPRTDGAERGCRHSVRPGVRQLVARRGRWRPRISSLPVALAPGERGWWAAQSPGQRVCPLPRIRSPADGLAGLPAAAPCQRRLGTGGDLAPAHARLPRFSARLAWKSHVRAHVSAQSVRRHVRRLSWSLGSRKPRSAAVAVTRSVFP